MTFLLGLRKFSKVSKKKFYTESFSGHFKKNFFWPYTKFPTLVKKFQKLKVARKRGQTLMEFVCKKIFTRLTRLSTPSTLRGKSDRVKSLLHQSNPKVLQFCVVLPCILHPEPCTSIMHKANKVTYLMSPKMKPVGCGRL